MTVADPLLPVSVVVPTRNESSFIKPCIDSLLVALARVGGGEVLVVDGRSTDSTRAIVEEYTARTATVRLIDNPERVTAAAFNLGIAHARSNMIGIVSAHSRVEPGFFESALVRLAAGPCAIVGGPLQTEPGGPGVLAWLLAEVVSHPFGVGNSRFRISEQPGEVDAIPFGVFRRQVFDTVGLFDQTLVRNQDTDFFGRVARAGLKVYLDPSVRSVYYARATLRGLLLQGFRNAYWNVLVWKRNPAAFQWRHAIPGLFATTLLGELLASPLSQAIRILLVFQLGCYTMAASASSIQIAWRRRRAAALLLPPLFFLYHLSYGVGSLAGLSWLIPRAPRLPELDAR